MMFEVTFGFGKHHGIGSEGGRFFQNPVLHGLKVRPGIVGAQLGQAQVRSRGLRIQHLHFVNRRLCRKRPAGELDNLDGRAGTEQNTTA
jgi:hypothetical protein